MANSNTRRLTTHKNVNIEGEELQVLIIWEEGCNKQQIKKENTFSKKHEILIKDGPSYRFVQKRA